MSFRVRKTSSGKEQGGPDNGKGVPVSMLMNAYHSFAMRMLCWMNIGTRSVRQNFR